MDNAQKAIMIGVGLFITIIIIAAVMLITGAGQDLMNQGTQQIGNISESLRIQVTDQYEGKVLTGSQVKAACSDLIGKQGVVVNIVKNGGTTTCGTYQVAKTTIGTDSNAMIKKYTGSVSYDSDTGVATVTFTPKSSSSDSTKDSTKDSKKDSTKKKK